MELRRLCDRALSEKSMKSTRWGSGEKVATWQIRATGAAKRDELASATLCGCRRSRSISRTFVCCGSNLGPASPLPPGQQHPHAIAASSTGSKTRQSRVHSRPSTRRGQATPARPEPANQGTTSTGLQRSPRPRCAAVPFGPSSPFHEEGERRSAWASRPCSNLHPA